MHHLLSLLCLLVFLSATAAQQPGRWPTYTSPKKDFSVSAPGPLKPLTLPEKTQGARETVAYQAVDIPGGRTYQVVRTTLSESAPSGRAIDILLDNMVNTMEKNVYRVISKEKITDKAYQRELKYLVSQGMHFRSRIYLKDSHLYTVSVSTMDEKGLDDPSSKKFLDSFKLLPPKK